jgi:hypothetical protein
MDLDPAQIGEVLLRLGPLSASLGHVDPRNTARDYLRPSAGPESGLTPEAQAVIDLMTASTEAICDRWFGGVDHARLLASHSAAGALG